MKCALILILALTTVAHAAEKGFEEFWERALVTVEITRKQYDYLQPWSRRVDQVQKMGTIIDGKEILTTADFLADHTLIRVQKGRGRWYRAEVSWIDHHANLATIRCPDETFWKDTKAAGLPEVTPRRGNVELVRWRNGILEFRNLDINRLVVKKGKLTFMDSLQLELDSEATGIGWAEAIVDGDKLIGLSTSKDNQTITALPSSFIRTCLEDRSDGAYQGLGYFSFVWQTTENPDTLAYLGQEGEPRGVVIVETQKSNQPSSLKPRDVILNIDGFDIDVQGDYKDPDYGNLLLENLASRKKRAGDIVKIRIMRDAEEMEVDYVLPKADYSVDVVPIAIFDQEPEYFVMGGLVFQPLTIPYLQSWGADWSRKAPFRLSYATRESPTPDTPSYVVLSVILPDPVNIGYQDARYLIVDKLNGQNVRTLQELIAAKEKAEDGFHLLEFREGDSLRRLILDSTETDAATQRVLQRYGIQKDRSISGTVKNRLAGSN